MIKELPPPANDEIVDDHALEQLLPLIDVLALHLACEERSLNEAANENTINKGEISDA